MRFSPSIAKKIKNLRVILTLTFGGLFLSSCISTRNGFRVPERDPDTWMAMQVTGYCDCGECCGWKRNIFGRAVIASGPNKGKSKAVGMTASGTRARMGTIAADTRVLPFGTILYVEGYGYGRVEDRGGAIQGNKIDLFFNSHRAALKWGRRSRQVAVWYPGR